jgi:hypothetical protein
MKPTDLAFREGVTDALQKFGADTFEPMLRRRSKRSTNSEIKHPVGWKEQVVASKRVGNEPASV